MEQLNRVKEQAATVLTEVVEKYGYAKPILGALGAFILLNKLLTRWGFFTKKGVKDEIVFITGGAMGIGKQMALKFALEGAQVVIADIDLPKAQEVASVINHSSGRALAVHCDVSSYESVREAANLVRERLGHPTILINNAGIISGLKLTENSIARMERTIQVNTTAHLYTLKEFLPNMISTNKGHIVTVASAAGWIGLAGQVDYAASKFGAVGLNESLRNELKLLGSKVKTTCVCPYYINTGMFEGVSLYHQWMFPMLDEQYVAKRVLQAVKQETEVLVMPWTINLALMLKFLLPTHICDAVTSMIGVNRSMETFKGRAR